MEDEEALDLLLNPCRVRLVANVHREGGVPVSPLSYFERMTLSRHESTRGLGYDRARINARGVGGKTDFGLLAIGKLEIRTDAAGRSLNETFELPVERIVDAPDRAQRAIRRLILVDESHAQ